VELQSQLNTAGIKVESTKKFDQQTLDAVMDYQKKNGLDDDGLVGPLTLGKLGFTIPTGQAPVKPSTAPARATQAGQAPARATQAGQAPARPAPGETRNNETKLTEALRIVTTRYDAFIQKADEHDKFL
jgi:peptidoglycan hydrolase-like protein with peptidoglycan-binding domain